MERYNREIKCGICDKVVGGIAFDYVTEDVDEVGISDQVRDLRRMRNTTSLAFVQEKAEAKFDTEIVDSRCTECEIEHGKFQPPEQEV